MILRCPLGYYLPVALAGKLSGAESADFFLYLWTVIGVGLFLKCATENLGRWQTGLACLLIIAFSGMDIIGYLTVHGKMPIHLTDHIEWWAEFFQYSSNTTLLFWVPNHAIPGWLIAALIYQRRDNPSLVCILPILMVSALLWSPLTTIGLVPFTLYIAWHHLRTTGWRKVLGIDTLAASLLLGFIIAIYLTMDIDAIPSGFTSTISNKHILFYFIYFYFIAMEFAILLRLLWRVRPTLLGALAGLTLALLPFFLFGPSNDLQMRGGIAATTVLCLFSMDVLLKSKWAWSLQAPILLVLALGAVTPLHELMRAVSFPQWSPVLDKNLLQVSEGRPPANYMGRLNNVLVANVLKHPVILQ